MFFSLSLFHPHFPLLDQVDSALMIDGTRVILDTFSRLLRNKPDILRNHLRRAEIYGNNTSNPSLSIDCKKKPQTPWEHGKEIYRYMKKVFLKNSSFLPKKQKKT